MKHLKLVPSDGGELGLKFTDAYGEEYVLMYSENPLFIKFLQTVAPNLTLRMLEAMPDGYLNPNSPNYYGKKKKEKKAAKKEKSAA
jgi:hypothetical protein